MCLFSKSDKVFSLHRLLLHMGLHTAITFPVTLTDQDQLPRREVGNDLDGL